MKWKRLRAALLAVAGAGGMAVAPGWAFNPQPEPPAFGMASLTRSQSAILSAVLTEAAGSTAACEVVLSFVDAQGEPFVDAAGAAVGKRVTLLGGVAQSLELRANAVIGEEARVAIRAVLQPPPDPTAEQCVGLVATLEIVNARGRTLVLYPGPAIAAPTREGASTR